MGTRCQTRRARDLSGGAGSSRAVVAKALAFCVASYAISALDLIPDLVPILDDVIVVPLGILAVVKLIPPEVMAEHQALGAAAQDRPTTRFHAAVGVIADVTQTSFQDRC